MNHFIGLDLKKEKLYGDFPSRQHILEKYVTYLDHLLSFATEDAEPVSEYPQVVSVCIYNREEFVGVQVEGVAGLITNPVYRTSMQFNPEITDAVRKLKEAVVDYLT